MHDTIEAVFELFEIVWPAPSGTSGQYYLSKSAAAGTPQKSVDYYGRIYGFISRGEAGALTSDIRNVTGHAARRIDAFVAENLNAWR
jgi:hypothetical protein